MFANEDFIVLKNVKYDSYDYKKINSKDIQELKNYALSDPHCMAFTDKGAFKFFIEMDKIVKIETTETGIEVGTGTESSSDDLYIVNHRYNKIPKIIHFIWFYGGRPFNLINYIAISAAVDHNSDYKIYLHVTKEPENNIFYDKIKEKVTINIITEPTTINNAPVKTYQHKADYVRLNLLKNIGGIYLDTDYILLKNLDPYLIHPFVIGQERPNDNNFLCNCVLMSSPNNEIIDEWLHIYNNSWNPVDNWMTHSVMIPAQLSKKFNMKIYESSIFYPFLWNDLSILSDNDNMKNYEGSLGVHLWDTEASKTDLLPMTLDYFSKKNNAFVRLFKKHVEDLFNHVEELQFKKRIYYGIEGKYKDVTELCYRNLIKDGLIIIPQSDFERAQIFGDPAFRSEKHILYNNVTYSQSCQLKIKLSDLL
jgi:hypothetical protein